MYQVSHLAGLFSAFNPDIVQGVDFYSSGFPARYGGRLSSVVDVTSRPGNMQEYKGSFSIGLINGSLQFEGPIVRNRTSFNVAMRHSWFDLVSIPALAIVNSKNKKGEKYGGRYAMYDINASVTHLFDSNNSLSMNFYTGRDVFKVEMSGYGTQLGGAADYSVFDELSVNTSWGNVLASLKWHNKVSESVDVDASVYYTGSPSSLGIGIRYWKSDGEDGADDPSTFHSESQELSLTRLHNVSAKADVDYVPSAAHHLRAGFSYVWNCMAPSRTKDIRSWNADNEYKEYSSSSSASHAQDFSLYVEDEISLLPWMKADAGLRYCLFSSSGKTFHSVEPRAALRFQCGDITSVKLSYSRMSQPLHYVSSHFLDLPLGGWYPASADMRPMISDQAAVGVYFDLPKGFELNLEGYWKSMDNIFEYYSTNYFFPPVEAVGTGFVHGRGRSCGVDAELGYRRDRLDLSAAYTLSFAERKFPEIFDGWFYDRYDNRHRLKLTGTYRFSKRVRVYASWTCHSGNRVTLPTQWRPAERPEEVLCYEIPNNYKLPAYHRLDIGADFSRKTRLGHESIWNVSIYNAYCRMNPFAVYAEYIGERGVKATSMAIFPIIPSFSYMLKF